MINQSPSFKRERASVEGACIWFDARSKEQTWPPVYRLEVPRSFGKFALRPDTPIEA